ncbi:hypothetical protein ZIOFF_028545 [Zingiber officinale]|uniref:Uncharacterized protein n=1 Tax=Zingiber officinale TaxID=94328 RepID=A0A8J5L9Y9_ZINOF|nr:hypothetical protein ZIOFF_028545 [Zingiber officinale]
MGTLQMKLQEAELFLFISVFFFPKTLATLYPPRRSTLRPLLTASTFRHLLRLLLATSTFHHLRCFLPTDVALTFCHLHYLLLTSLPPPHRRRLSLLVIRGSILKRILKFTLWAPWDVLVPTMDDQVLCCVVAAA